MKKTILILILFFLVGTHSYSMPRTSCEDSLLATINLSDGFPTNFDFEGQSQVEDPIRFPNLLNDKQYVLDIPDYSFFEQESDYYRFTNISLWTSESGAKTVNKELARWLVNLKNSKTPPTEEQIRFIDRHFSKIPRTPKLLDRSFVEELLFHSNIPLAFKFARRFKVAIPQLEIDDLLQVSSEGLVRAIRDKKLIQKTSTGEYAFSSMVRRYVQSAISEFVVSQGLSGPHAKNRKKFSQVLAINKIIDQYQQANYGVTPDWDYISKTYNSGKTTFHSKDYLKNSYEMFYVFLLTTIPLVEGQYIPTEVAPLTEYEEIRQKTDQMDLLKKALNQLTLKERQILALRYSDEPWTQREIAQDFFVPPISYQAVQQQESRSKAKLREILSNSPIKDYL